MSQSYVPNKSVPVRVRFAPSPTGYLHVGGARTALYNYLFARRWGGKFILRIEDTDEARSTIESLKMQIEDLKWLGLDWDEGPHPQTLIDKGHFGPYRQSQRRIIYKEWAEKIIAKGLAYYCFMTDEEISQQRQQAEAQGKPPQVNSPYRHWTLDQAQEKLAQGTPATVRFKVMGEKRDYVLNDLVRGEVRFPSDMVGDFVLMRSSGMPVFNFCCAIDDHLMQISHVLRAEEHLSNTLRQMMIFEALGWKLPEYGHLSIILGPDKQKLSKRHGATSCNDYRENGFLQEAMNNFIALLGWSSPQAQEILSREELIEQFSPDRLHAAAAVFDEQKLHWVNATHLRNLPHEELWQRLLPFFNQAQLEFPTDMDWQDRALSALKTSMMTLKDGVELFKPLAKTTLPFTLPAKDTMSWESSPKVVAKWRELIAAHPQRYLTEDDFHQIQEIIKKECAVKGKFLFMPIRVAIIGKPEGAELKVLIPLIDKEVLVERADMALSLMDSPL
ncbi:MAG: glutamate--tRNA ligase [Bdellovibrionales bacterium]|nr:glutamate--tRNA ligase [Bdellovibrionales bacterium]